MAAEIILPPIIEKAGENLVAITGRQFGYLIHYKRNIENLKNEVEKLEGRRKDVQDSIDAAKRNGEEIRNGVKIWIARVDRNMEEAKKVLEDDAANVNKRCFLGWFPDLTLRYRLSREATTKTITVIALEAEVDKFIDRHIANPAPPPGIESMSSADFVTFETTKLAMLKVMEALKEDKINFIGIHGMGGVGKTTLVKEIAKNAKEDKLFDNIVFAVVSQIVDLKNIQGQIAGMLGNLNFNDSSELGRARQLQARLKNEKRILVILDDVWARLDVEAIGIPFGCKMLITTRREQVCRTMGMGNETTEIIPLDVLSEQESWDMFRRNAGDVDDSPMLTDVAQEVARECRGLPIALVTVGRAMRGNDLEGWKEAAKVLKKSMPAKIEGVDEGVVRCIKLSYDYLRDEEAKSCFLLCSLFPEDHKIKIEYLVRYGMGLGIFENVDTINEARGRTRSVINSLNASCLLLASDEEGCIKMHDVVRDVAISIGSDKYLVRAGVGLIEWPKVETLERYTGISLMYNKISKHPEAWECPNLKILLMQNNCIEQYMPEGVFKGMKALRVLDRSRISLNNESIKLEPSLCYLTNLRTLILAWQHISDTSALGEIKTIEILSFVYCEFQESLNALRHLTNLRLLDLSWCRHSSHIPALIPPDVISSLSRLEELNMFYVRDSRRSRPFAYEGSSRNLPSIVELKSLPRLTILRMNILELSCIPADFVFPDLEIFTIHIGPLFNDVRRDTNFSTNYLTLSGVSGQHLKMSRIRSLNCIKALLGRTNHLSLDLLEGLNNVLPDLLLDRDCLNALKTLRVENCDEFEYLINSEELGISQKLQQRWFYDLEELVLFDLENFKGICHGVLPPDLSFAKLKKLEVFSCHKLRNLFRPAIARTLEKLEELKVTQCKELEEIVAKEQEGQEEVEEAVYKIVFPRTEKAASLQALQPQWFLHGELFF